MKHKHKPSSSSHRIFIIVVLCLSSAAATATATTTTTLTFTRRDNFLIDCGSTSRVSILDGKSFQTDEEARGLLEADDKFLISDPSAAVTSPILSTARIFLKDATYTFPMQDSGWHWVRLHFLPLKNEVFEKLETATFNVYTDELTLLHSFSYGSCKTQQPVVKEYLVQVQKQRFSLRFVPQKGSAAFINAIEVVTAPEKLIGDSGQALFPVGPFDGLTQSAYQTVFRVNVGGPLVTSENDTLGRTWVPDDPFLVNAALGSRVAVQSNAIKYPETVTTLIAPATIYSTAVAMADAAVAKQMFNVTWEFNVERSFSYLVRLHFCDIISKALNDLYFNVYVNGKTAFSGLDLSSINNELASPVYQDIVVDSSLVSDQLKIQICPVMLDTGSGNAILNGVEILKMNNSASSLDGEFRPDGKTASNHKQTVAAVGFAMMFGAFVGLGAMVIKWHKRPQDWQRSNSFSSWLLPLHAGDSTLMASKSSYGSQRSSMFSTGGLGRRFTFSEIQESTKNFDSNVIIGVGGFGNVYLGIIDGHQVAVKRGNPQSEQGINEFMTEIQMLSKLRHKHLVSLIGYCDEDSEMILVYEYMSNGPLRDHLYGKNLPSLSWKQRLEICIGAARGLHYLHTGSAQGIIHRDVKTTNILLDDNFVAKMADFGLSKDGPDSAEGHVSTAVKGSFGYLDPEYFRKQQLTDKSDVYSFGVVLLEALCARPAINPALPREQVNLAEWAMQWKRKGMLEKIIDPVLVGTINPDSLHKFAEASEKCLANYGVDRPTMGDVLWNLEYALQLHEASSKGKAEDENRLAAAPSLATIAVIDDDKPQEGSTPYPTQAQAIDERSGTVLLAQFNNLSGR
ncbi:putative receptor-like protein [Drosera capensis]